MNRWSILGLSGPMGDGKGELVYFIGPGVVSQLVAQKT
jgi:hypothetical protein